MDGDGGAPEELIDVALCERFGWTWTELDEQDMARVLPAVGAANARDALRRVYAWMEAAAAGKKPPYPPPGDFAIQKHISDLRNE